MIKSNLENLPRYQTIDTEVDAALYNQVKLALLRLGAPIRFTITSLRSIDVILESDYWACVDSSLNDIPVFAWIHFDDEQRDSLHKAIPAKRYSYHVHADIIVDQVRNEIMSVLDEMLKEKQNAS